MSNTEANQPNSRVEQLKNLLRHPLFIAIVSALLGGALGGAAGFSFRPEITVCINSNCSLSLLDSKTKNQVELPPDSFSFIEKSPNSFQIKLSPEGLQALAPITQLPTPPRHFVTGLEQQKIVYADKEDQIPQVKKWLENPYSGYPALVKTLKEILANRQGIGNPVPLTIIQGEYTQGDPANPPLAYAPERLKQAYLSAWHQKNSGSPLKEFDEIAPLNQ